MAGALVQLRGCGMYYSFSLSEPEALVILLQIVGWCPPLLHEASPTIRDGLASRIPSDMYLR
jgi:hypothetical protein